VDKDHQLFSYLECSTSKVNRKLAVSGTQVSTHLPASRDVTFVERREKSVHRAALQELAAIQHSQPRYFYAIYISSQCVDRELGPAETFINPSHSA
jgi:hypothetical protein